MKLKSQPPRIIAALAAIVLATLVLVTNRLGASDICGGDEAVEAVFVQQMVEHGHLLFPVENGAQPMYKPPLFHWSAFALDRLTGQDRVTAFNLRATAALYAIAGVIMTIGFALWLFGPGRAEGAILAGLALAGSYQYINQGRFGRVDMTLCFFEAAALFSFARWLPPERDATIDTPAHRMLLYVLALALGLAVLAKGPVGALLPGAAMLTFLVIERRWRQMLAMLEPGPLIVGAALASSWYVACYFGGRFGFLNRQLGSENVGRFFGSLGAMPPWYYVKPLLLNSAPLSLLVPVAVVAALKRSRAAPDETTASAETELRIRATMRLFAIFWISTVVFFTIAAYKRRSYLLPLWPPAAVMLAWLIVSMRARAAKWVFAAICAGLIVFNLIYIPHEEVRGCADSSYRQAAQEINRVVGPGDPLYTFGFHEELAPLLFYLNRDAPSFKGRLGDAPPGYVIVPQSVWRKTQGQALDLTPVLTSDHGERRLILLRRGKTYANATE
ncbi:MAG: ArnT family glycosyltransferase [Candidatus Binataceae bacterium]